MAVRKMSGHFNSLGSGFCVIDPGDADLESLFQQEVWGMVHRVTPPSLTKRLAFCLGLFSLIITLVIFWVGLRSLIGLSKAQLQVQADQLITFLARSYDTSLWNFAFADIEHVSEAIVLDRSIGYLEVRETGGRILFSWTRPGSIDSALVHREADIVHNGAVLGSVRLGLIDIAQERTISMVLSAGGGISVILMLVQFFLGGALLTSFLKKQFSVLHYFAERYKTGDYSLSNTTVPYREFVPFVNILVAMGATIDQQMAKLRDSEQQFRAIVTNAPIGIYRTTFDGRIVEVNPAFVRMFGYTSREELFARGMDSVQQMYVSPDARWRLIHEVQKCPEGIVVEEMLRRVDGTHFPAVIRAALQVDDGGNPEFLDSTVEDIGERKRTEEALRASQEKFGQLFRLSPQAIIVSNTLGRVLEVNHSFESITGYMASEVLGTMIPDLGLFLDPEVPTEMARQIQNNGRYANLAFEVRRKNQEILNCEASAQVLTIHGEQLILTVIRDVTESIRMQQMMVQTEKLVSLGGIAAGIAHEINNPLGIIMQTVQNLVRRTQPDFQKNIIVAEKIGLDMNLFVEYMKARDIFTMIEDIQAAALRTNAIIRHLLNFSRKSESNLAVCNIQKIVENALLLAKQDYDLKRNFDFQQIHIEREYDANLPLLWCTESEIELVVLNLLRNAAQAMASANQRSAPPRIVIRIMNIGEFMRLEIEDNGPGMSPDIASRVFEPFYTTKPPGMGTGLGLSISYFIVTRSNGGRLNVYSAPGEGAKFVIELPWGNEEVEQCVQK